MPEKEVSEAELERIRSAVTMIRLLVRSVIGNHMLLLPTSVGYEKAKNLCVKKIDSLIPNVPCNPPNYILTSDKQELLEATLVCSLLEWSEVSKTSWTKLKDEVMRYVYNLRMESVYEIACESLNLHPHQKRQMN